MVCVSACLLACLLVSDGLGTCFKTPQRKRSKPLFLPLEFPEFLKDFRFSEHSGVSKHLVIFVYPVPGVGLSLCCFLEPVL